MQVINCDQGSAEWHRARCGKVTGSRVKDVLNFRKDGKPGADREKYKVELITEILTGSSIDHYVNDDMRRGQDLEPIARSAYEIDFGATVTQYGFILHPTIQRAGYSPDGIAGDTLIEIKCPRPTTHVRWMLEGGLPEDHEPQVMFGLGCTGLTKARFISFCPEMPDHLQLWTVPVERSQERIDEIDSRVKEFLSEVHATLKRLTNA